MTGPLVSVIVPVYNGARFLLSTLNSVFAMTYEPFEVIVVDDGSTDNSARIARSFEAVKYFKQPNKGPAVARNTGIASARGEFLAFVDADDEVPPTKLEVQVGHLLAHVDTACVLAHQEVTLEPTASPLPWMKRNWIHDTLISPCAMSMVIRSEVMAKVGGFDPRFPPSEDMDLLFRVRREGFRIEILPDVVVKRRVHGSNLSYNGDRSQTELLRALKGHLDARKADP